MDIRNNNTSPWLKPRAILNYQTQKQNIACGFNRRDAMNIRNNNTSPVVDHGLYKNTTQKQNIACGFNRRDATNIRKNNMSPVVELTGYIKIPQTKEKHYQRFQPLVQYQ